ncbi:hypothetical protein EV702DRAFT_1272514, partial [Suillus placidus]
MTALQRVWIDRRISPSRWKSFYGKLMDDWSSVAMYSTVILAMDNSGLQHTSCMGRNLPTQRPNFSRRWHGIRSAPGLWHMCMVVCYAVVGHTVFHACVLSSRLHVYAHLDARIHWKRMRPAFHPVA